MRPTPSWFEYRTGHTYNRKYNYLAYFNEIWQLIILRPLVFPPLVRKCIVIGGT